MAIHLEFVKAGLTETAVLQFTQDGRLKNFDPELIEYMRETPNWDYQIHGWAHDRYPELETDFIVRDISAACWWCDRLFGKKPTVWYPPWNLCTKNMERAAQILNLTISNESYDIARFIREVEGGHYEGTTLYFHGWNSSEMLLFPKMIELLKGLNAPSV